MSSHVVISTPYGYFLKDELFAEIKRVHGAEALLKVAQEDHTAYSLIAAAAHRLLRMLDDAADADRAHQLQADGIYEPRPAGPTPYFWLGASA